MELSPRRTRGQRRVALNSAEASHMKDEPVSVKTTTSTLSQLTLDETEAGDELDAPSESAIRLPDKLTNQATGLNTANLKILLKKQHWLRRFRVELPEESSSLRCAVNATLVFGQEEAGTAICFADAGLLLTCSHCVAETEEDLDLEAKYNLLFASGQAVRAMCIAWDSRRDLAVLRIVEAQNSGSNIFPSISIASQQPKIKDAMICIGHPGSEDLETSIPGMKTNYDVLHASSGAFRGYAKGQDLQDNSEIGALKHDCWTYWGHSGAPLVSAKTGELLGLHSSWDDQTGRRRGISLEAVREFLREHGFEQ